jgi:hypothetical protein
VCVCGYLGGKDRQKGRDRTPSPARPEPAPHVPLAAPDAELGGGGRRLLCGGRRRGDCGARGGGLRQRVPARSGPRSRGGGADPPGPGPSPAAEASPLTLTREGASAPPPIGCPRLECPRDPQGTPRPQVCHPQCPGLCVPSVPSVLALRV